MDMSSAYQPPRTRIELEAAVIKAKEIDGYTDRLRAFLMQAIPMKPYECARYCAPERLDLFRNTICTLIAYENMPIEFSDDYNRFRRYR